MEAKINTGILAMVVMRLLGLDVGTTGCKSDIFSTGGKLIASAYKEYRLHHREPGWSELDPEEVWNAVVLSIRQSMKSTRVDPRQVKALATSALGEAFIPVDKQGRCLYWSMTTHDARAVRQTESLVRHLSHKEIFSITGQPASPQYVLPKIQWIKECEPKIYKKTWKFLCWDALLNLRLCGFPGTDYSMAARTLMFDIRKNVWSQDIIDAVGITQDQLPEVKPAGSVIGESEVSISRKLGLQRGTLIVAGAHDAGCEALSAGLMKTGPMMERTGTVQAFGVVQDELRLTDRMRRKGFSVNPYLQKGHFYIGGGGSAAGVALRWFRDYFARHEIDEAIKKGISVYDILTGYAAQAPAGSLGLFVVPYFMGKGTPEINARARGVLFGLNLAQGRNEVLRSILEGVAYELRSNIDAIEGCGIPVHEIRAVGGGARSKFWLQLKADVVGRRVATPNVAECAAQGAVILAGVGAGIYSDPYSAVRQLYTEAQIFEPRQDLIELYDKHYLFYQKIERSLRSLFKEFYELWNE